MNLRPASPHRHASAFASAEEKSGATEVQSRGFFVMTTPSRQIGPPATSTKTV
jgi:hypothetical protein